MLAWMVTSDDEPFGTEIVTFDTCSLTRPRTTSGSSDGSTSQLSNWSNAAVSSFAVPGGAVAVS